MAKAKYPIIAVWEDGARPGSWLVRVTTGPGTSLRRRAPSREEAEAKGQEIIGRLKDGLNVEGGDQTLDAFVSTWWERAIMPRGLAPATMRNYKHIIELYVLPYIGTKLLRSIDAPMVIDLYAQVRRECSVYAANDAVRKLSMILGAARRWKYVRDNAAADARADLPSYVSSRRQPLSREEIVQLLAVLPGHQYELAIHVLLLLGVRVGEVFGLQWGDIDWQQRTIAIRRQSQDLSTKRMIRETTKTRAGYRTLPLPPSLLARLRERWDAGPSGLFLFPDSRGRATSPIRFNARFNTHRPRVKRTDGWSNGIINRAGLRTDITPHYLRHTAATMMMELGVSEEVRAAILGHGARTITQHYSHAALPMMREAIERWEREFDQLLAQAGAMNGVTGMKKSADL